VEGDATSGAVRIAGGADLDGGAHRMALGDACRSSATNPAATGVAAGKGGRREGDPIYCESQLIDEIAIGGRAAKGSGGSCDLKGMNNYLQNFQSGLPCPRSACEDKRAKPFLVNWNLSCHFNRAESMVSTTIDDDLHHGKAIRQGGCSLPLWHWQAKFYSEICMKDST
jgi:hypothetical protein